MFAYSQDEPQKQGCEKAISMRQLWHPSRGSILNEVELGKSTCGIRVAKTACRPAPPWSNYLEEALTQHVYVFLDVQHRSQERPYETSFAKTELKGLDNR